MGKANAELIRCSSFNKKFRNYARDIYTYGFKEKNPDSDTVMAFEEKGRTFDTDELRLHIAFDKIAGVEWSDDTQKSVSMQIIPKSFDGNPFLQLYNNCSETSAQSGEFWRIIYSVLLYYSSSFERNSVNPLEDKDRKWFFERWVRQEVEHYYSYDHIQNPQDWASLTHAQRKKYVNIVAESFFKTNLEKIETDALKRYNHGVSQSNRAKSFDDIPEFSSKHTVLSQVIEDYRRRTNDVIDNMDVFLYLLTARKIFTYEEDTIVFIDREYVDTFSLYLVMCELSLGTPLYSEMELTLVGDRQFENQLKLLEATGILIKKKEKKTVLYALNKTMLQNVFEGDNAYFERVREMLHFLSCSDSLGSIGYLISQRMGDFTPSIQFKHQYLPSVLNDYNKIDLLYALKHHLWVNVTYRDGELQSQREKTFWCFPVEIRESVNGLQYLIYYLAEERTISAARLDYINGIDFGTMDASDYFDSDIDNAHWLLQHTWGSEFKMLNKEDVSKKRVLTTVRFTIEYDRETEKFIERRIMREIRNCPTPKKEECSAKKNRWVFEAEIAQPQDIYQWAQSYISRIVSLEIVGDTYTDTFCSEISRNVSRLNRMYNENQILQSPKKFDCVPPHEMLFNEIFSEGFRLIGNAIINLSKSPTLNLADIDDQVDIYKSNFGIDDIKKSLDAKKRKEISDQIEEYRLGQVHSIFDFLFEKTKSGVKSKYRYLASDSQAINGICDILPLTLIEVQWLINVLSDTTSYEHKFPSFPMSRYFLSIAESNAVLQKLENPDLFDNEVNLYDQFIVSNTVHQQIVENNYLQIMLDAIKSTRKLEFDYQTSSEPWHCYPYKIEYSRRDNVFRLLSRAKLDDNGNHGKTRVHNLDRITRLEIEDEIFDPEIVKRDVIAARKRTTYTLVVVFDENKSIADTIINEFSPWTKKCIRHPSGQYQMTIEYDAFEYKEIGIRLLSYGCDVFIASDDNPDKKTSVLEDVKNKINAQKEFSRILMDRAQLFSKEKNDNSR